MAEERKTTDPSKVDNGPLWTDDDLYYAAVATAIASVLGFAWGGYTILSSLPHPGTAVKIAQALSPIGVGMIAFVTLLLGLWRGRINDRQAHEQKRQNDDRDKERTMQLLLDGTELLSDDMDTKRVVGVVALKAVIASGQDEQATEAMNMLADLIESRYDVRLSRDNSFRNALWALHDGARLGFASSRAMWLTADRENKQDMHVVVGGIPNATYRNGTVCHQSLTFASPEPRSINLENCVIDGCRVSQPFAAVECTFQDCHIEAVDYYMLTLNTFVKCDFSGCCYIADDGQGLRVPLKINGEGNFYSPDNPPDWADSNAMAAMRSIFDMPVPK